MKTKIKNAFLKLYIRFKGRPGALRKAIKEADRLHKKNGKRYRVFFFGYEYKVWDRGQIRKRIKEGLFRSELKAGEDFDRICFYDTLNPERYVFDK